MGVEGNFPTEFLLNFSASEAKLFSSSYKIDPYKYTMSKFEIGGVKIDNFMNAQRKRTGELCGASSDRNK